MELDKRNQDGLVLCLGANVRPRTESEDKYKWSLFAPPPAIADLNIATSMVRPDFDPRPAIFYQGGIGSCASCTSKSGVELVYNAANPGRVAKTINPGPLYAQSRIKQGWFPQDSGSYLADNLDQLLLGSPLLTAETGYVDSATYAYDNYKWDEGADYEFSHLPFYPSGGTFLEHIWNAINQNKAVALASAWPDAWFNPKGGKLPAGIRQFTSAGHAFLAWAVVPGFVLCANSWSTGWSADAAQFGFQMRPGDFAVPFEYFQMQNGPFWEGRVLTAEKVVPQPEPPKPEPPKPEPPKPEPPKPEPPTPDKASFTGVLDKVKMGGSILISRDIGTDTATIKKMQGKRVRVSEL